MLLTKEVINELQNIHNRVNIDFEKGIIIIHFPCKNISTNGKGITDYEAIDANEQMIELGFPSGKVNRKLRDYLKYKFDVVTYAVFADQNTPKKVKNWSDYENALFIGAKEDCERFVRNLSENSEKPCTIQFDGKTPQITMENTNEAVSALLIEGSNDEVYFKIVELNEFLTIELHDLEYTAVFCEILNDHLD